MGDQLLVGSCSGNFYALDADNGTVNWAYDTFNEGAKQFHGIPAVVDSIIYVGTDEGSLQIGTLYAFNINNGRVIWKRDAGAGATSDLIVRDSLLYLVNLGDNIIALNRHDGSEVWSFQTSWYREEGRYWDELERGPRIATIPILTDSLFIFPGRDDIIYCLDARSGERIWETEMSVRPTSQLLLIDSLIAVGTEKSQLLYFQVSNGKVARVDDIDWVIRESMSWHDGTLFFLAGNPDDWRTNVIAAYDVDTQNVVWSRQTSEEEYWYVPRLHVHYDALFAGTTEGALSGFSLKDGARIYQCRVDGPIRSITSDKNYLYVGTFDGILHALEFLK